MPWSRRAPRISGNSGPERRLTRVNPFITGRQFSAGLSFAGAGSNGCTRIRNHRFLTSGRASKPLRTVCAETSVVMKFSCPNPEGVMISRSAPADKQQEDGKNGKMFQRTEVS
nr:hypothetical protein [uncultured Methanoregula sp.]